MNENKYREIFRLKKMLEEAKISFEFEEGFFNGFQIREVDGCEGFDVIEHDMSYGREEDRLEIMGLLTPKELKRDSVSGNLTAENVFKRILKARKTK